MARPSTFAQEDLDVMLQLLGHDGGKQVIPEITQSLRDRRTY